METEEAANHGAIGWHVRRHDLDLAGWRAFIAWLEESPRHARAYDRIAMLDALLPVAELPARVAVNDNSPHYWRWGAGVAAVAASLALLVVPASRRRAPQSYAVQTRAGEARSISLTGGTAIELAGGSRLLLDRADPRSASLEHGEALFHVRYDAQAPFIVHAGQVALRDLGTVFDVARGGARLNVAVAEGSVMFQPEAEAVVLGRGEEIAVREDDRTVVKKRVDPADVGGWTQGQLSFDGTPLAEVAATIHRVSGAQLVLEGDLPTRVFTGMVRLTGAANRDIPHIAALIGARWRRRGDQWILGPEVAASR